VRATGFQQLAGWPKLSILFVGRLVQVAYKIWQPKFFCAISKGDGS
jgi:hypothetical protein